MKNTIVVIATILVLAFAVLPLRSGDARGAYNTLSHLYWCDDKAACIHEIGHKLDQEGGWISHTPEFDQAYKRYLITDFMAGLQDPDFLLGSHYKITILVAQYPASIHKFPYWIDIRSELYATFLEMSGGIPENVPAELRGFYEWDRVEELILRSEAMYR